MNSEPNDDSGMNSSLDRELGDSSEEKRESASCAVPDRNSEQMESTSEEMAERRAILQTAYEHLCYASYLLEGLREPLDGEKQALEACRDAASELRAQLKEAALIPPRAMTLCGQAIDALSCVSACDSPSHYASEAIAQAISLIFSVRSYQGAAEMSEDNE